MSAEPDAPDDGAGGGVDDDEARAHLAASGGIDRRKSIIGGIVAVVFLAIVFTRVIPQIGDYAAAADYIRAMTFGSLVALVVAVLWYQFVFGWPFVAATPGLSYPNGFVVNQSAFTVANGIPGGGAFGLALQYAQLTSYRATPTAATAAIGAKGVWGTFVTLFMPVTGVVALSLAGDDAGGYVRAAIIGVGVLVGAVVVFALILRSEANAVRIGGFADKVVNSVVRRFRKGASVDVTRHVLQLRHDTVGLIKRRWHVITLAQIGVAWSQFGILYVAMLGVSQDSGDTPLLVVYGCWAISQLGIMIPVTPGGLGTVDAVMIGLMTSFGIDAGVATAADLVWRASSYVPQIIIGLIAIFYWRWEVRHDRRQPAV